MRQESDILVTIFQDLTSESSIKEEVVIPSAVRER